MMPAYLRASALEYRHRYLLHGIIYTLGLAAPWQRPFWSFLRNGSAWFIASNTLAKPGYQFFAVDWNGILVLILLFAGAGAAVRIWGAAYLGADVVQSGTMLGDRVIAAGPYRYTRNPLYLGTICHSVAVAMLMRPAAAVLTLALIVLLQFRLIGREEQYLQERLGQAYLDYLRVVPRLLPGLHHRIANSPLAPDWKQGILSEVYMIGCFFSFALLGWTTGFAWEATILHVVQGIVVAFGLSVVARAFIPKPKPQVQVK